MSGTKAEGAATELVLEFALDASAEAVWRAVVTPELRARWLPGRALSDAEVIPSVVGRKVRFRMRDDEPPYVETPVTFAVTPRPEGGTLLRISHGIPGAGALGTGRRAADGGGPPLMRAA